MIYASVEVADTGLEFTVPLEAVPRRGEFMVLDFRGDDGRDNRHHFEVSKVVHHLRANNDLHPEEKGQPSVLIYVVDAE